MAEVAGAGRVVTLVLAYFGVATDRKDRHQPERKSLSLIELDDGMTTSWDGDPGSCRLRPSVMLNEISLGANQPVILAETLGSAVDGGKLTLRCTHWWMQ